VPDLSESRFASLRGLKGDKAKSLMSLSEKRYREAMS